MRLLITAFALIAFALQSYVTQTHIHLAKFADSQSISKQHQPADKYPAKDDPANCPICQEIMHAGQYVAPGAIVFSLPAETIAIIPVRIAAAIIVQAVSHDWRGRAPPKA